LTVDNPEPLREELLRPHRRRLRPDTPGYDRILALHEAAIRRGENGYEDPLSGLWVMTAEYLWQRGYCCYSGCRHCPWIER
jgi:hypothetical protein